MADRLPTDTDTNGSSEPTAPDVAYYALDSEVSVEEFLAVSKVYARDVVRAYDLSVSVSALDWEVSKRAKRRAGAVKHRDGEPLAVSLTWEHFQERGWGAAAETVRHELLHVHLLNEHDDPSHGERFRTLADRLQTGVHCERFADPNWWVVCASCGSRLARYRRSKLVAETEAYRCGGCGGRLRVVDNREHS
ncbi:SprT-like domain-containing protein [Halomarina oriensis]|uniref:SprT domain-containing protein n=1 Tax=Halomarina oriensis TaxID=671145 RepID=A0A6B0GIC7_9EURY|nr:SprT-like domain-containing protein [Halomarina oriensis]MWG34626.1 sprT domain-containing protein [Halomarina oriensis]